MKLKRVSLTSILWSVFSLTSLISGEKYAFVGTVLPCGEGASDLSRSYQPRVLDRRRLRAGDNLGHFVFFLFSPVILLL